jgi:hypothetical protein
VSSVRRTRLQAVVGGGGEPFDDRTRRALREAAELLSIAQEQATIQATAELMTSCAVIALLLTRRPEHVPLSMRPHRP